MAEKPRLPTSRAVVGADDGSESPASTVYDEVGQLFKENGWARGGRRRGRGIDLRSAIDQAVGVGNPQRAGSEGVKLARAARIGSHLRDLTNVRSLDAWEDDRDRTLDDVIDLLARAAFLYPDD